ncbi:MAG: hypothetical protein M1834_003441 [Cirrosporium novae-zelandiae]|nr:MAG: hypothetical protein M1834_003441 [Cirrosporium novae-zelandiae]
MAANEYYQAHPDRYDAPLPPPPQHSSSHSPDVTISPQSQLPSYPPPDPASTMSGAISTHHPDAFPAQNTGDVSDTNPTYYGAGGGGRLHDSPSYADDIPLRVNPPQNGLHEQWPDRRTQYPPSPESQLQDPKMGLATGRRRRNGLFSGRIPWVVYTLSLIQLIVFIVEIVKYAIYTKSPIEIHPQFNYLLGPSSYLLINMGARFVPCMRTLPQYGDLGSYQWPCPNTTSSDSSDSSNQCSIQELCGFSYFDSTSPNQWYRFIVPIFLHAGVLHIAFNLLLQFMMGREMEQIIGSIRFFLVYFSSGIFGFVLGGNYAATGIASTGCSGSLFGILALTLLDLLYHWNERAQPGKELLFILIDVIISFVLGLLPGLDNYSHIGGFLMGLVLGVCILRSPNKLRQRTGIDDPPYAPMPAGRATQGVTDIKAFIKRPVGFFKGRKPLWWAWWLVRVAALVTVFVAFIVLLNNFYKYRTKCSWCKYLSCLPVKNWCDVGNLSFSSNSSNSSTKRDLLDSYTYSATVALNIYSPVALAAFLMTSVGASTGFYVGEESPVLK